MKVLIIDHDEASAAVAGQRLTQEHIEVLCAHDGQDGLTMAAATKPDLILLDVNLPRVSGFDVCRRLKSQPDLAAIPVIFLASADDADERARGLELGAVDYIAKPFDDVELEARVKATLRTKHFADMLSEYAQVDPLTELPNHRSMTRQLRTEWARLRRKGPPFSFILLNLDHFQAIIDRHSRIAADRVLKEVARVISSQCRRLDTLSRYGEQEFAILLPNETIASGNRLAERCRQAIEQMSFHLKDGDVNVTASFGVADTTEAESLQGLIEMANRSLDEAKAAGRNTVRCVNTPLAA